MKLASALADLDRQQSIAEALGKTYGDNGEGLDLPLHKFIERFDVALAATGYTVTPTGDPFHVVEFREEGWFLHHPLACRPNLSACHYVPHCQFFSTPGDGYGRYQVTGIGDDDRLVLEHLSP